MTTLLVHNEFRAAPAPRPTVEAQPDWMDYIGVGNRVGPPGARVMLVNFVDYQCPACRALEARIAEAQRRFPNELATVYRHYPIDRLHPYAERAGIASECAAVQGKFPEMHAALFAHQDSLGLVPWGVIAERAGVADSVAFALCLDDRVPRARILRDREAGDKLKVRGTPTFLIDGVKVSGTVPQTVLDSLIATAIQGANARQ